MGGGGVDTPFTDYTPHDWGNGSSADIFFMHSMVLVLQGGGGGCYSRKWVWSSRTELCCIASGK